MNTSTGKEYAGFVKDISTGKYIQLFVTEISAELAEARAIEKARERNNWTGLDHYDVKDHIVKERDVIIVRGEWKEVDL
jgi:hypothetical protein